MLIRSLAVLILILSFKNVLFAQAPATVPSDSGIPTMQRFFLEGDLLWTRPHLSGNKQPNNFDETFAPQLTFGWNLAEAQAFFLSYRYMKA
jgi:signal peptidase I